MGYLSIGFGIVVKHRGALENIILEYVNYKLCQCD